MTCCDFRSFHALISHGDTSCLPVRRCKTPLMAKLEKSGKSRGDRVIRLVVLDSLLLRRLMIGA
uniref:Uncharacterized protein n=1 Tax=Picea glauca TaxID=3330 RepID=A0A101LW54_PICGL|nr:hypothetical protein ABT39_MTgene1541 [Picea glauca]